MSAAHSSAFLDSPKTSDLQMGNQTRARGCFSSREEAVAPLFAEFYLSRTTPPHLHAASHSTAVGKSIGPETVHSSGLCRKYSTWPNDKEALLSSWGHSSCHQRETACSPVVPDPSDPVPGDSSRTPTTPPILSSPDQVFCKIILESSNLGRRHY